MSEITKTVMIVEDDPSVRALLSMTLEDEAYRVETAADGLEALDKLQQQRPDAILLDLMLPGLDGRAVIASLDHDLGVDPIPIIAVSAGSRYLDVGEHGVHAYLSKPFQIDTLLTVLAEVLAAHPAA